MSTSQKRRSVILGTGLITLAMLAVSGPAAAQAWPTKPVRIIVPFAPGGTADMLGRVVAQKLTENLKQSFIIDNRPGAGGLLGMELAAKSAPDGYTLVVSGVAGYAIAPVLSKKPVFDPQKDFSHIALFGGPPAVLAVTNSFAPRDLKEFIAYAKTNPGKISYGSAGNGSQGHLFGEQLKQLAGINMVHVPYKGLSQATADMIAGHIEATSGTLSSTAGQLRAGKARGLAVASPGRVPEFPNIPTFAELGYPELTASTWFSLSGPAGMPKEIVQRLNREVRQILQLPDVREKLRGEAIEPGNLDTEAFGILIADEIKRWGPIVRASGAQVD